MSISNETLSTLAVRAVRALEDNKTAHPVLAEFDPVLLPLAAKFHEAFDAYRNYTPMRVDQMGNRHDKCTALYLLMRNWGGALTVAIPSYDANKPLGGPKDPDPLIAEARRLISLLHEHGENLVNRETFTNQLNEALAAAIEERAVSLRILKQHQALEAVLAPIHSELYRVIGLIRDTLRNILGPGHADYQALRIRAKPKKKVAKVEVKPDGPTPAKARGDVAA